MQRDPSARLHPAARGHCGHYWRDPGTDRAAEVRRSSIFDVVALVDNGRSPLRRHGAPGGVVARGFVSHASADLPIARRIREWLGEDGHDAFLAGDPEHGIPLGDDWQARLHERLRWADAMVCVLTSAYTASAWCAAEVGIAQSHGLRLLPVRVEPDVHAPLLASTQQFELTTDGASARSDLAAALVRIVLDRENWRGRCLHALGHGGRVLVRDPRLGRHSRRPSGSMLSVAP